MRQIGCSETWLVNVPPTIAASPANDLALSFVADLERLAPSLPLALAVSGGSDSLALLQLTADWAAATQVDTSQIHVLTVDHGLRAEALAEAKLAGEHARAAGFTHTILPWMASAPGARLQERARDARYALMGNWCRLNKVANLLAGHTEDDQLETVGMRLLKGSGTRGLAGMPVERNLGGGVRLLRPLLSFKRHDLQSYLMLHGLEWVSDPSNRDSKFERVRMRDALRTSDAAIAPTLESIAADSFHAREALDHGVDDLILDAVDTSPFGWARINVRVLHSAPDVIRLHGLARLVRCYGGQPFAPKGDALLRAASALAGSNFHAITLGGALIYRKGEEFLIGREARNLGTDVVPPHGAIIWDGRYEIQSMMSQAIAIEALGQVRLTALGKTDRGELSELVPPRFQAALPVLVREGGEFVLTTAPAAQEMANISVRRPQHWQF